MDRRSISGLESEVLAVHVCYSFLEVVMVWMRDALRRSEGGRDAILEARNKECRSCFRLFVAVLQEIASSGNANGNLVLVVCNGFARNGALSNGHSGNPS